MEKYNKKFYCIGYYLLMNIGMTATSYDKRLDAKTIKSMHWNILSLEMKLIIFAVGSKEKFKAALPRSHHKMHYPLLLKWTLLNKVKGEFIACSLENNSQFQQKVERDYLHVS
jgi:hypothetical protein